MLSGKDVDMAFVIVFLNNHKDQFVDSNYRKPIVDF
jgi:hypothetical protein